MLCALKQPCGVARRPGILHARPAAPLRRPACPPGAQAQGIAGLDVRPYAPAGQGAEADDQASAGAEYAPPMPPMQEWPGHPWLLQGCEPGQRLRVAVLVSGGVDSSLALALAQAAGHRVTAFYLQIWFQEDFRNFWDACPWEEDLQYARQVCEALGVELVVVPLTQQYWDRVVGHSVAEIAAGRTPNPDMLCNSRVKFGAFYEYLEAQHGGEFDRVASGHYARLLRDAPGAPGGGQADAQAQLAERRASHAAAGPSGGGPAAGGEAGGEAGSCLPAAAARLALTPDAVKDQTYFLAHLTPGQLARCMFPLGPLTKPQVRALARAAGLATSGRKDSQGICFLGRVRFSEFVKEHLGEWPGPIVDAEGGQVLGLHQGYWFYTVGQRGGIKLPGGPWYVVAKDMTLNVVTVSRHYYEGQARRRDSFLCGPFSWLVGPELRQPGAGAGAAAGSEQGAAAQAPRADAAAGGGGGSHQQQPGQGDEQALMVKVRHGPHMYACQLRLGPLHELQARQGAAGADPHAAGGSITAETASGAGAGAGPGRQQHQQPGAGQVYGWVVLEGSDQGLAPGQHAVFYRGGVCLGAAVILEGAT